jgi:hypothetical protein
MSHEIGIRDRQVGKDQAWHGLTIIEDDITPEIAHPYEVAARALYFDEDQKTDFDILIASDDNMVVGKPFNRNTYEPNTIKNFWEKIYDSVESNDYEIISAGSCRNRSLIFASLKVHDGFEIEHREYRDYLSFLDGFDSTYSFRAVYSNICIVCSNTFHANLGKNYVAKCKHSKNFTENSKGISEAVKAFFEKSMEMKEQLTKANQ